MPSLDRALEQQALRAASQAEAVVVFGSHARGQAGPESDLDVLAVVAQRSLPYREGVASVSPYTLAQLIRMASKGSLFVLHLLTEGVPIRDEHQLLMEVRRSFRSPGNYEHLRRDVCAAARLLDVDEQAYLQRWRRFHALVCHLVRTYSYSLLSDRGQLVFDTREAAKRLGDVRLVEVLALARQGAPAYDAFLRGVRLLVEACGGRPKNPYGSVEALIVNCYGVSELTVILGLRLLNDTGRPLEYESLEEAVG